MQLEGLQHTTDEIETLRLILEAYQKRPIAYDEALEIGEALISYFKILAEEPTSVEEE